MTIGEGAASTPYGPAAGTVPGGPPGPPAGPPGYGWQYALPARRGNRLVTAGLVITAVVALAALAVGIIALVTRPAQAPAPASPSATSAGDTRAADRALCNAIAPLMTKDDRTSNTWRNRGDPGTPARDAALPKYRSDTEDWVGRIQPILDQHPDANPLFRRTLQRFIDDRILYVWNARPGPPEKYDKEIWADSLSAYGGSLHICYGLGVTW
ncbi:hypothetical protein [Mycobacterium sp.]|uniref:hypothetical protein n=1 Tax=Mycobacterium sp. TaxID=1785 RepID=UPI003BAA567F